MHDRHLVSPRPRVLVVAVAAVLAWASVAAVASAAPDRKTYSASLNPSALVAGGTYGTTPRAPILLTISNTSSSASLGSANIAVPEGILATAVATTKGAVALVGAVIQLRELGLSPGESVVASVSAQTECAANHASYTWSIQTKQANDFNGTGNDLSGNHPSSTIAGTCGLAFTSQPAHAEKTPGVITSEIYDSNGDPVAVTVVDAQGVQTVSWWTGTLSLAKGNDPTVGDVADLTGALSGPAVSGSATFAPRLNISATGYTLIANASPSGGASQGVASGAASVAFNIVDDATVCAASTACFATAGEGQKTKATVNASANGAAGDLVILSIADPTVSLDCGGYTETSDVVVFNVTDSTGEGSSTRSKQTTLTLAAAFVTKKVGDYRVCYQGDTGPAGLLPNCDRQTPVPPCVVSKEIEKGTKNLVIVIASPPGDPLAKF